MEGKNISILVDNDSWILGYARRLENEMRELGYIVQLVRDSSEVEDGWINFMLGCTKIVGSDVLSKNSHNLVVHESALPDGRGFAPMTWQIIEGKVTIPVCLIEADDEVDSGVVWIRDEIKLDGSELCPEWRAMQGDKTIDLCLRFIRDYERLSPQPQDGVPTWYERRRPENSELDIEKSIAEQFNLLRTVDNEKYPAYFNAAGKRYIVKIMCLDGLENKIDEK